MSMYDKNHYNIMVLFLSHGILVFFFFCICFPFQKTKIFVSDASGRITSWQIDGEMMETVTDFILGGSKITADGDCSHEIKRCLLLERKL